MQRFFPAEQKPSSHKPRLFCIGAKNYHIIYPYKLSYRKKLAEYEPSKENLIKTFPLENIKLYVSEEDAYASLGPDFNEFRVPDFKRPGSGSVAVTEIATCFEVVVDHIQSLQEGKFETSSLSINKRTNEFFEMTKIIPCFKVSIEHIDEIVSVQYQVTSEKVVLDLSDLSAGFLKEAINGQEMDGCCCVLS